MGLFRENKMNRLKGIMGILLSLVLVVGMIPALPARAEEEGPVGPAITIGDDTTFNLENSGYLASDNKEYCEVNVPGGRKVTLDLNGCTLKGSIVLGDNTSETELTIVDTSPNGGGKIYGDIKKSFSGVTISNNCKFTMNGGTITNHLIGVDVLDNDGTFIMNNGTISGNGNSGIHDYDRGVRNNKGTFTMTGGKITGNDGGVYNSGTFTMTGGSIESNSLKAYNSKKSIGGGLYNDGNFVMEGGKITGNSDDDVYMKTGVMSVSKDINVGTLLLDTSNPASGDSPKVTLDGPLKNTNKITIKQTGKLNSYTFTKNRTTSGTPKAKDYADKFQSADPKYEISVDGDELVYCVATLPPSNNTLTPASMQESYGYSSGSTITNNATAASLHRITGYQWYENSSRSTTGGTAISGATSRSYTIPTGLDVGNHYYYCVVTTLNTEFGVTRRDTSDVATFTVNKADAAYTTNVEAVKGLVENNAKQELVTPGATSFGEIEYALGRDDATVPATGWSTETPVGVNAEMYYVWYKVEGTANYNGIAPACLAVPMDCAPGSYGSLPVESGRIQNVTESSDANAEPDEFKAKLKADTNELLERLGITEEEVNQGVNVWVKFNNGENTLTDTEKALLENGSGEYTIGQLLNISLYKKVGDSLPQSIHETAGDLTLTFQVPEELIVPNRAFGVMSGHEEKAEMVASEFNRATGTLTIENDEYSPYAIVYLGGAVKSPGTGDGKDFTVYIALLLMYISIVLMASVGGMKAIEYSQTRKRK